jgi:RecJ-like exonuclease
MPSNTTASSDVDEANEILVQFHQQIKPIILRKEDNWYHLKGKVNACFRVNVDKVHLELQYYDNEFCCFIDLDDRTWAKYRKNEENMFNKVDIGSRKPIRLIDVHQQRNQQDALFEISSQYFVLLNLFLEA